MILVACVLTVKLSVDPSVCFVTPLVRLPKHVLTWDFNKLSTHHLATQSLLQITMCFRLLSTEQ